MPRVHRPGLSYRGVPSYRRLYNHEDLLQMNLEAVHMSENQ